MLWTIYLFSSILISLVIATMNKRYYFELFFLSLIIFMTPTITGISNSDYAPALFTFFFNLLLEETMSLRPLRPLVISIPVCMVPIFVIRTFKRKRNLKRHNARIHKGNRQVKHFKFRIKI